jgi:hypothetical protein
VVVGVIAEVTFLILEDRFEVVAFRVVPELYVPAFPKTVLFLALSVRDAVRAKASSALTFTTTQRNLSPILVSEYKR